MTAHEFPIPAPEQSSDPQGIASGPDGALWFTEYEANKIGRITTGGAMQRRPSASRPDPTARFG